MSSEKQLKQRIVSEFQLHGFNLKAHACDFLLDNLRPLNAKERTEWLEKITEHCQKQPLVSPLISKEQVETAILDCCKNGVIDEDELINVISAFQVPKFNYNTDRKKFLPSSSFKPELFCNARIKGRFLKERYDILHQRTLRNVLFHGVANDSSQYKLRPVEFLLNTSRRVENVVLLGLLTLLGERTFYLEDPSGMVQLDLSRTNYHDGLFADCSFVLAEGNYEDKVLQVSTICLPPAELSEVSRVYYGSINTFGGPSTEPFRSNSRLKTLERNRIDAMFVFVSDCFLDQPKVLEKLGSLFRGYDHSPPTAFVLMGNFISSQKGSLRMKCLKEGLKALGELIAQSTTLVKTSKFILIPGPEDSPVANILPRPELPELLVSGLRQHVPNVILGSNPCRIQYCTQEIVVIREDLITKLCRNSIHFPLLQNIGIHFAKTIVSQAHLAPLSLNVCPIYWDFDHALQLYPCPDLIVVADQQLPFTAEYNNCRVVNPGPFGKGDFIFKVYYPATKEIDDSQIPEET